MQDFLEMIGYILLSIFGIIGGIFLIGIIWASTGGPAACKEYAFAMETKTSYSFWNGCFVEMPNGEKLPRNIAEKVLQQKYKISIEES